MVASSSGSMSTSGKVGSPAVGSVSSASGTTGNGSDPGLSRVDPTAARRPPSGPGSSQHNTMAREGGDLAEVGEHPPLALLVGEEPGTRPSRSARTPARAPSTRR